MNSNNPKSIPERMCVSCRERKEKKYFYRLLHKKEGYKIDATGKSGGRGIYVCKDPKCIQLLSKNRKYNVDIDILSKLLDMLKKEEKKLDARLEIISKSKEIVFGIKITREKIWNKEVNLVIISNDINEKNREKIIRECDEKEIPHIFWGSKEELGKLIGKREVNVIGILDKRVSEGLINSLGGEAIEST